MAVVEVHRRAERTRRHAEFLLDLGPIIPGPRNVDVGKVQRLLEMRVVEEEKNAAATLIAAAGVVAATQGVRGTPSSHPVWSGGVRSGTAITPFILAGSLLCTYLCLHAVWRLQAVFDEEADER